MLRSHSVVSSSRNVRPCSPWGGRWIGHWRTTWSTVCLSAPHSQVAEEDIPHLYKQGRKRPTPVRRWLSWTTPVHRTTIPGRWVPVSRMNVRSLVKFSNYSAFHRWSTQSAACMLLLLSDKLMSCCAAGTNRCLDVRRHASALGGQMGAEWSRCPGSMARRARGSATLLRRSSTGWMPARIGRLSVVVGRRHPDTVRQVSLVRRIKD